jgi:hypothetical protein
VAQPNAVAVPEGQQLKDGHFSAVIEVARPARRASSAWVSSRPDRNSSARRNDNQRTTLAKQQRDAKPQQAQTTEQLDLAPPSLQCH